MKLAKAMATVAGLTGLSRIAGFIRDILTAAILGAGPIADAFFVALKLPNFFRRVTAEGAFSVAFVPLYSAAVEKRGREEADRFASNTFMVMLAALSVFSLIALAVMPYIIAVLAPGFEAGELRFEQAVEFSRITFLYLLLMSLTALLGGVLNALDRFAPFAFAPVLFNLCLIAALLLSGHFENAGLALSVGILAAGILQLAWLLRCARRYGFNLRIALPKFDADIKKVLVLMGPGVIGAGVMHINLFADMIIASFLEEGSISYLYYADRLNQLPLGMVGIAVGTALLPMLSKAVAGGERDKATELFNRAMEYCFLLALPAAMALAVFADLIITVLFERGAFEAQDSFVTASVLMMYVLGLPAYISIKVFSTVHWAHQDTKTPVRIAVISTLTNIILSIVFAYHFGVVGLALGTGLVGWMQFGLHLLALRKREGFGFDMLFRRNLGKILCSSFLMILGVQIVFSFLGSVFAQWLVLLCVVAVGVGIYCLSVVLMGVIKPADILRGLKRSK